jgi:hypothetical protein
MSKDSIRKQSGVFLENIPKNNNAYKIEGQDQFYTTAMNIGAGVSVVNENPSLTGASKALLPMRIATVGLSKDKDGNSITKRLEFTMLINPETWNHSKSNSVQPLYTRNGWIAQPWGPNQDTISSTGRTAGFMLPALGFTNIGSEMSFGYLNFLSLMSAYKNNGYEYEDFTTIHETTRVIKMIRGIQLSYDNNTYMGHFNNFTLDEDETFPFGYSYNFEFIISALDGSEYEVRGHYQKLPVSEIDLETGTEKDPRVTMLVADPVIRSQGKPPDIPVDSVTRRLWEQKTGLAWSEALSLNYTDGSFQKNLALRKLLVSKTWDKSTKKFI